MRFTIYAFPDGRVSRSRFRAAGPEGVKYFDSRQEAEVYCGSNNKIEEGRGQEREEIRYSEDVKRNQDSDSMSVSANSLNFVKRLEESLKGNPRKRNPRKRTTSSLPPPSIMDSKIDPGTIRHPTDNGFFKGVEEEHSPKDSAALKDKSAPVDPIVKTLHQIGALVERGVQALSPLAKWTKIRVSWKVFILFLVLLVLGFTAWFCRYQPMGDNQFFDRWTGRFVPEESP